MCRRNGILILQGLVLLVLVLSLLGVGPVPAGWM